MNALRILRLSLVGALLVGALSSSLQAELRVEVDRRQLRVNESLNLQIISDVESPEAIDLQLLPPELEIISRSSRRNLSIVNGQRSSVYELSLTLFALEAGEVVIPPLELSGERSQRLVLNIAPEATGAAQIAQLELTSEFTEAYVLQEIPVVVRLRLNGDLAQGELSSLEVEDAQVELVDEVRYRQGNGEVIERHYVLYPQSVGKLSIPSLRFQGTLRRNSGAGLGSRLIRSSSAALDLNILPPASGELSNWLPATAVRLTEQLQPATTRLQLGEPLTRNIVLEASGALGTNLPEIQLAPDQGDLRQYRDQSQFNNSNSNKSIVGTRTERIVYIPQRVGQLELPEVVVPWWDVKEQKMAYARLPARQLQIAAPAASAATDPTAPAALLAATEPATEPIAPPPPAPTTTAWLPNSYWFGGLVLVALCSLSANCFALAAWWRSKRRARRLVPTANPGMQTGRQRLEAIRAAADTNNLAALSVAWRRWLRQLDSAHNSWRARLSPEEAQRLQQLSAQLERCAWSAEPVELSHVAVLAFCSRLERKLQKQSPRADATRARKDLLALYPSGDALKA